MRVENEVKGLAWVADARARLREEGHVYFGEVLVVPSSQQGLVDNIVAAQDQLHSLDWKLHEIVIMPVHSLEEDELVRAAEEDAEGIEKGP
jgi:hypothetical protein